MNIPIHLRAELISASRGRCCLHRLNWHHSYNGMKWEALQLHHVIFRSCGGSDKKENLIPLCPTCHDLIHREARSGGNWMPDDELKRIWNNWLDLPNRIGVRHGILPYWRYVGVWPNFSSIPPNSPTIDVKVTLKSYGFDIRFLAYKKENYKGFRTRIIQYIITTFRKFDEHFPFIAEGSLDSYSLSCDPMVFIPDEWNQFSVDKIVSHYKGEISLVVPALIVFNTGEQLKLKERLKRTL